MDYLDSAPQTINRALADSLMPIVNRPSTFFSNAPLSTSYNQQITNPSSFPISISQAQQEIYLGNGRILSSVGHESRMGEKMYAGGTVKPSREEVQPPKRASLLTEILLPGVIALFLFIFVFVCISNHRKQPYSHQALKYYAEHPEIFRRLAKSEPKLLERVRLYEEQTGVQTDRLEGQWELPLQTGLCRKGLYLSDGMCFPCEYGLWDGTRCLPMEKQQNPANNQELLPRMNTSGEKEAKVVSKQETRCKEGQIPLNGKCLSCPEGSIWNGSFCVQTTPNLSPPVQSTQKKHFSQIGRRLCA